MGRHYENLVINESDRKLLNDFICQNEKHDERLAVRAKMVLGCAEGKKIAVIAQELGERSNTVILWRERYRAGGISGLYDKHKTRREKKYGDEVKLAILSKIKEPPPEGQTTWNGNTLAEALDVPAHVIWKILRNEKIELARKRSWSMEIESDFQTQSFTVVGIFLSSETNALVMLAGKEAEGIPSIGKMILPNRPAYEEMEKARSSTGKVSLYEALTAYRHGIVPASGNQNDHFPSFLNNVMKDKERAYTVVLMDSRTPSAIDFRWKIAHPNTMIQETTHENWMLEISLWCNMLFWECDRDKGNALIDMLQKHGDATNNLTSFAWYR